MLKCIMQNKKYDLDRIVVKNVFTLNDQHRIITVGSNI